MTSILFTNTGDVIGDSTIAEDRGVCSFIWDNRYYEKEQINEYDLTLFIAEDFNPMENAYVSERTADSEDALLSEEGAGDLEDTMFSEEEGGENGSYIGDIRRRIIKEGIRLRDTRTSGTCRSCIYRGLRCGYERDAERYERENMRDRP